MTYRTYFDHDFNEAREWYLANSRDGSLISYNADLIAGYRQGNYRHSTRDDVLRIKFDSEDKFERVFYDMNNSFFQLSYTNENTGTSDGESIPLSNIESVDFRAANTANTVKGNKRDNNYYGGEFDDSFNGDHGDDTFYVGRNSGGSDYFDGGEGFDRIFISSRYEIDFVGQHDGVVYMQFNDGINDVTITDSVEVVVKNGREISFESLFDSFRRQVVDTSPESTDERILNGSIVGEDFFGGLGRDIMTGRGGADRFYLVNPVDQALERNSDEITDFNRSEEDMILIAASYFDINPENAILKIVGDSQERRDALRDENTNFVFDQESGELLWNRNGGRRGDGNGLMATLVDQSDLNLTQSDFQFF